VKSKRKRGRKIELKTKESFATANHDKYQEHCLNQEGNDGSPSLRVVWKLLLVVLMFSEGPDCHLEKPCSSKHTCRKALGHDSEGSPGIKLIGVVWTGDVSKELCEGVGCRIRDPSLFSSRRSEVSQCQMNRQVTQLRQNKDGKGGIDL